MMTGKDYNQQSSLGQPHHCSGTFADDSCPELHKAVYYREKKKEKRKKLLKASVPNSVKKPLI